MNRELADRIRNEICDSAFELIKVRGYSNCTIKDFALQAGVSVGTVYNYFESKEHFLSCLRKKASQHLLFQCKNCVSDNLTPMAKLNTVTKLFCGFQHEYAFLYDVFGTNKLCGTLEEEAIDNFTQMTDLIETVLQEGMRQDHFKSFDSRPVARLFILAYIGALTISSPSLPISERPFWNDPFEDICSIIKTDEPTELANESRSDCR